MLDEWPPATALAHKKMATGVQACAVAGQGGTAPFHAFVLLLLQLPDSS
jgi:hypothetical protein